MLGLRAQPALEWYSARPLSCCLSAAAHAESLLLQASLTHGHDSSRGDLLTRLCLEQLSQRMIGCSDCTAIKIKHEWTTKHEGAGKDLNNSIMMVIAGLIS